LLSVTAVADQLGLRHAAVRRAIMRGELPAMKVCGRIRIEPADLRRWLDSRRIATNNLDKLDAEPPRRVSNG
jgi:excisionase family DNA binding protein